MVAYQGGQSSTLRALRSSRRTITRRNGLAELHTVHGPCCATPSRHRRRAPQCGADSHEYRQDDCTGDEIGMPKTHFLGRTPAVTVRASEADARFVFTHVLEVADLLRELRVKLVQHAVQYQHLDLLLLRVSQSAATHFQYC